MKFLIIPTGLSDGRKVVEADGWYGGVCQDERWREWQLYAVFEGYGRGGGAYVFVH